MDLNILERAAETLRQRWPDAKPTHALVCGSGWSEVVEAFDVHGSIPFQEIEGYGRAGVKGHAGLVSRTTLGGLETIVFQGRRHVYEGEGWTPIALPIYLSKALGVQHVTLTNAAGGIRDGFQAGDLMLISDHINFIGTNPLIGPHRPVWGTRFPDQTALYHPEARARMKAAAAASDIELHEGVYLAASGPAYETPAEIRAFRALGADAVGMSTVPEAMLANAAGLTVTALSCITNLAAGISPHPLTHAEVTEASAAAMPRMRTLVAAFWDALANDSV